MKLDHNSLDCACVTSSSSHPPLHPGASDVDLVESGWPRSQKRSPPLDDAVGQREAQLGSKELLDVRATDVGRLGDLGDAEDLDNLSATIQQTSCRQLTWMERKRAR
jgi:hypothetical protein